VIPRGSSKERKSRWIIAGVLVRLIDSVQQNHSSEINSRLSGKEITQILQKRKVHYSVHNSLTLVPIFSQLNSIHTLILRPRHSSGG
jgi:hypothetical protein